MICRDEEQRSAVVQQDFIVQRRANRAESAWRKIRNLFHNNGDISFDSRLIFVRTFQNQDLDV